MSYSVDPEVVCPELFAPYKEAYLRADVYLGEQDLDNFYKSASKMNEYGIKIAKRYKDLGLHEESQTVICQLQKVINTFLGNIKR